MFKKLTNKIAASQMCVNYRKMWKYVKPYWGRALLALVITIPIGAMDAVIAWALKPYMDIVMIEKGTNYTVYIPILIILFTLVQSIFNYSATYLNTWVGQKVSMGLKTDLFKKLLHYHAAFFDKKSSGEIVFRFNNDVDTSCNGLLSNLKLFTTRLFSSISLIAVLFYNSWQLAIVAVIVLAGALYPLTTVKKRIKSIMDKSVFSGSNVVTHFNETFSGNRIISSYNLYDYQAKRFEDTLHQCFKLGIKMTQRTGIMSPMMHFIVSVGIAAVIWLGSYLIVTHTITPGNFVSFIAALIMLYTPIKAIGNNFNAVQMALMAMDRVFELLDGKPDIVSKKDAKLLSGIKKGIEYRDVCFEYEPGKPVLKHIMLRTRVSHLPRRDSRTTSSMNWTMYLKLRPSPVHSRIMRRCLFSAGLHTHMTASILLK